MAGKVEKRREELRSRLIEAAEARIAAKGITAIKARDLAADVGCAVGAIYNVFADLNDIIIAVNGRTFRMLGQAVSDSVRGLEEAPPTEVLIAMSNAYLQFAIDHPNLWRSLFDVKMSTEMEVPSWYLEELMRLFSHISAPLRRAFPDMSDADSAKLTLTRVTSDSLRPCLASMAVISAVSKPPTE